MGMPQIPEGIHRPSTQETVVDLLESIALEEMAISHILNAQGEQMQALIQQFSSCSLSSTQLLLGCRHTQDLLNSLIMKEWLLYNKLGTVLSIDLPPIAPMTPSPTPCTPQDCATCIHRCVCQKW